MATSDQIPAVEVRQLRKTYADRVEAVKGIDFTVAQGEVFGLLGPNGAGKSTTIGMLTTTVQPTSGSARLVGYDVARQPLLARGVSSVVFQDAVVDGALSGRANLELHARLWGVPARRPTGGSLSWSSRSGSSSCRPTCRDLQRRRAAPARDRPRARLGAEGPVPRRADRRPRPTDPARAAGRDRRAAHARVDDDRRHHPLPRRGGTALRSGGDHPPGHDRRARQPPGAARGARPRDPRVPGRRQIPMAALARCASGASQATTRSPSARA